MKKVFITLSSLFLCSQVLAADVAATKAEITRNLGSSNRSDAETARDANRKPAEVLEFFGLRDDMRVLELVPAGGYWSKFLAPTIKGDGEYFVSIGINDNFRDNVMSQSGAEELKIINPDLSFRSTANAISFDESNLDLVLTFWNLHNIPAENRNNLNTAVFNSLASGGVYGVVDHTRRHSEPGSRANGRRLDPVVVIKEMLDIGFEFDGYSDMHFHPEDDLTQEVGSPGVRGNTDRFVLKFSKP